MVYVTDSEIPTYIDGTFHVRKSDFNEFRREASQGSKAKLHVTIDYISYYNHVIGDALKHHVEINDFPQLDWQVLEADDVIYSVRLRDDWKEALSVTALSYENQSRVLWDKLQAGDISLLEFRRAVFGDK